MRTARRMSVWLVATGLVATVSACGPEDPVARPAPAATTPSVVQPDESPSPDGPAPTTEAPAPPSPVLSIPGTFRTRSIISLSGAAGSQRQRITDAMWDFRGGSFTF